MFRLLTVLVALVAQGVALLSPVCFVRCVSASGQESVELAGRSCHCCECDSQSDLTLVCAVVTCQPDHDTEHDGQRHDEPNAPAGWQDRCEHCSCRHSPLVAAPLVRSKSLNSSEASRTLLMATLPATLDFDAVVHRLKNEALRSSRFQTQESPHLIVVATVVLRV